MAYAQTSTYMLVDTKVTDLESITQFHMSLKGFLVTFDKIRRLSNLLIYWNSSSNFRLSMYKNMVLWGENQLG